MTSGETFHESFGALQLRSQPGRTEDDMPGVAQTIGEAVAQWNLRTNHDQIRTFACGDVERVTDHGAQHLPGQIRRATVPALPGETITSRTLAQASRRVASACSRPPEPMTRILLNFVMPRAISARAVGAVNHGSREPRIHCEKARTCSHSASHGARRELSSAWTAPSCESTPRSRTKPRELSPKSSYTRVFAQPLARRGSCCRVRSSFTCSARTRAKKSTSRTNASASKRSRCC